VTRKTQVLIATAIGIVCLVAVAAAERMKNSLSHLAVLHDGEATAAETGREACAEPPAPSPQASEFAATSLPSPPRLAVTPEPPLVGSPVAKSSISPVPPRPDDATVARSAPRADLLPPVTPATAEPPLVETAVAKPPVREDNVWRGEPIQVTPPRSLTGSVVATCLWTPVAKPKAKRQTQKPKGAGPFVGTFFATLDERKELVLPQAVSEQMALPHCVYVTPGPENCLWICNAPALVRLTATLEADSRRLFFAQTVRAAVDRAGRLALPESLWPIGCRRHDFVLIGVGDHFELWNAERFQRYVEQKLEKTSDE